MKIIKVTYTTTESFVVQNQDNIKNVMIDLRNINNPGIHYNACLASDGKTFIHTAFFNAEEDQQQLNELPSFKYFQAQLKSGGLEVPPKAEQLILIGSFPAIFNK